MKRSDLVVLKYNKGNSCHLDKVKVDDPSLAELGLVVDLRKGIWYTPQSKKHGRKEILIGKSSLISWDITWGIIGVYDRTKLRHIANMVDDACEAQKERGSLL